MLEKFDLEKQVSGELIYDYAVLNDIKNKFPIAIYENAKDDIHPDRISISIPGISYKEFFIHALDIGYHSLSLTFQLLLDFKNKEFINICKQWIDKQNKREGV